MASSGTIPLLAADPELERLLRPEDWLLAEQSTLPVHEIPAGPVSLADLLDGSSAFAALLLDGILIQTVLLGDHAGLRLIGPGDLLALRQSLPTALIDNASLRATVDTRVAVFGDEFLAAASQLPHLMAGVHDRSSDQNDRLLTQMMICQLPRVDDRLLSMLWLLADTWGRVTPSGTIVPIRLTHGVLGGLVGARRSTVTLALKELTDRGALLRQSDGWLLLEAPRGASQLVPRRPSAQPYRLNSPVGEWGRSRRTPQPTTSDEVHAELNRTVERLRAEHDERSRRLQLRLRTLAASRERLALSRERIMRERESRLRVPSS
jgi:CRP/FNR family cyclic AMP-dependent transcriptional regulator